MIETGDWEQAALAYICHESSITLEAGTAFERGERGDHQMRQRQPDGKTKYSEEENVKKKKMYWRSWLSGGNSCAHTHTYPACARARKMMMARLCRKLTTNEACSQGTVERRKELVHGRFIRYEFAYLEDRRTIDHNQCCDMLAQFS